MKQDIFERKQIQIGDGNIYYVQQFPPFKAMKVLGELQKAILPALGGAAVGFNNSDNNSIFDGIGGGLLSIAENIDGDKLESLTKMLLNPQFISVKVNGDKEVVQLDDDKVVEIFTGRAFDMLVLAWEVAKVNFLDLQRLCAIPTGFVSVVENVKAVFAVSLAQTSSGNVSSTAPLTQE